MPSTPRLHTGLHSGATETQFCRTGACPSALEGKSHCNTCYGNAAYGYLQSENSDAIQRAGTPSVANIIYSEINPLRSQSSSIRSEVSGREKLRGVRSVRRSAHPHSHNGRRTAFAEDEPQSLSKGAAILPTLMSASGSRGGEQAENRLRS